MTDLDTLLDAWRTDIDSEPPPTWALDTLTGGPETLSDAA